MGNQRPLLQIEQVGAIVWLGLKLDDGGAGVAGAKRQDVAGADSKLREISGGPEHDWDHAGLLPESYGYG